MDIDISHDVNGILTEKKIRNYLGAFREAFKLFDNEINKELVQVEDQELKKMYFNYDNTKLKEILRDYSKIAKCVKDAMGKSLGGKLPKELVSDEEFIDSHKIASIFVIVILKHSDVIKTFITNTGETTTVAKIPHIYFAFVLGVVIIEGMYNAKNPDNQKTFYINKDYWTDFVKLVYANREAIQKPLSFVECNGSINGLFFMSHLFYFIEKECETSAKIR